MNEALIFEFGFENALEVISIISSNSSIISHPPKKSSGNGIIQFLNLKILLRSMPPDLHSITHAYGARAFGPRFDRVVLRGRIFSEHVTDS